MVISVYKENRKFADQFFKNKEIDKVLYKVLKVHAKDIISLEPSTLEDDYKRAIDYEITIKAGKIACRIRNLKDMKNQSWRDLTIRSKNNSYTTEIDKLQTSEVRWYLYCWAYNDKIIDWMFIDLNVIREEQVLLQDWKEQPNYVNGEPDGTAFIIIPFKDLLKHHCIIDFHSNIISAYVREVGYKKQPKKELPSLAIPKKELNLQDVYG